MVYRLAQGFMLTMLIVLLLLVVACGVFVYLISPLRYPGFQPDSTNLETLVLWLHGITNRDWLSIAISLATLLSTNLTLVFYQWSHAPIPSPVRYRRRRRRKTQQVVYLMLWFGLWVLLLNGFWLVFLAYLSNQWLID